jgi:hypothetical protein
MDKLGKRSSPKAGVQVFLEKVLFTPLDRIDLLASRKLLSRLKVRCTNLQRELAPVQTRCFWKLGKAVRGKWLQEAFKSPVSILRELWKNYW